MSGTKTQIENALDLEEIDANLFRSETKYHWKPLGGRAVFGGQVVGQALAAAARTVDQKQHVHSLHSYFLLPGNVDLPIVYHVERTRDGRSFSTRSVRAMQNGKVILSCQASFQLPEKYELEHQFTMPDVPLPESIPTMEERIKTYIDDPSLSEPVKAYVNALIKEPVPIDMRQVDYFDWRTPQKVDPGRQRFWMRAVGALGDDLRLHQCVAAYESDHRLLATSLLPHGELPRNINPRIGIIASLDHSMWFHEPFRADEWLLFDMQSPRMISNRGFANGYIYNREGRLVVSIAQEGLIRMKPAAEAQSIPTMTSTPPAKL